MEKRSVPIFVVLSIVTCGVFYLIWLAMIADDIKELSDDKEAMSGGMVLLLSIVTCGIYTLVWYYQAGKYIAKLRAMRNMPVNSNMEIVYLLLGFFGFGIVSVALIQNEVNDILDVSMAGGGYNGQCNYNQLSSGYGNANNGYNNSGFNQSDFDKQQVGNNGHNNYCPGNNNYNTNMPNHNFNNSSTGVQNSQNCNNVNNSEDTK